MVQTAQRVRREFVEVNGAGKVVNVDVTEKVDLRFWSIISCARVRGRGFAASSGACGTWSGLDDGWWTVPRVFCSLSVLLNIAVAAPWTQHRPVRLRPQKRHQRAQLFPAYACPRELKPAPSISLVTTKHALQARKLIDSSAGYPDRLVSSVDELDVR